MFRLDATQRQRRNYKKSPLLEAGTIKAISLGNLAEENRHINTREKTSSN